MGYEIVYFYNFRQQNGEYDTEVKELKKKVGEPFEDIPLIDVFKHIMKQLSRRDILVKDVKIYELVKKEISFRETKGGIVIKNKKFMLESADDITVQDIQEAPLQQIVSNGAMLPVVPNNKINLVAPTGRPIKWVALDPSDHNLAKIHGSGLAFLLNKRYPVFSEVAHPKQFGTMIYTMLDENKREVTVMDDYFVNADQKLVQGFNSTVDRDLQQKLSFDDYEKSPIPDIRGGKK